MSETPKPRGRPAGTAKGETGSRLNIYLPLELIVWLKNQPECVSKNIQKALELLRAARSE
jgi:hypothetical protein